MHLILTIHAKEQMVARSITKGQIIDAIKRGGKVPRTDGLLASHGYIKVAYKIRGEKYIIKTVMVK